MLTTLLPLAVYTGAIVVFASGSSHALWDFPLDDAWIHRVYARAFAFLQGFAFNDGTQEAGATSPLWVVVTAPAHWLESLGGTGAVVLTVKAIGAALGAAAVLSIRDVVQSLSDSRVAATLAASLFAIEPRLHFSILSGMEVVLLVACWLAIARAVCRASYTSAVVLLGLTPIIRPEAFVIMPVGLAGMILQVGVRHVVWLRPVTWAGLLGPTSAWMIFCRLVNGHWLPNTYYVKASRFEFDLDRLRTVVECTTGHGWASLPLFAAGLAIALVWLSRPRCRKSLAVGTLLFVAPLAYLVGVTGTRSLLTVGYYWLRWADPPALVLTAAFVGGVGWLLAGAARPLHERNHERRLVWKRSISVLRVAAFAGLVLMLPGLAESFGERRARLASDSRAIRKINVEPGLWIRENTPPRSVLGVSDAGALRYFGKRHTVDLGGLNNADVAFGRVERSTIVQRLDWVVVFPHVFEDWNMGEWFDAYKIFEIPSEEYTVCPCPGQTIQLVAERRVADGSTVAE